MQQYPPGYTAYPAPGTPPEPTTETASGDGMDCPECGRHLDTIEARRKEALTHYGEKPIPVYHNTRTARERQAALLGKDLPED